MSQLRSNAKQIEYRIRQFHGVNENADGDANLTAGEAAVMRNFRITNGGAMKVRPGYEKAITGLEEYEPIVDYEGSVIGNVPTSGTVHQPVEFFRTVENVNGEIVLKDSMGVIDVSTPAGKAQVDAAGKCYYQAKNVGVNPVRAGEVWTFEYVSCTIGTSYTGVPTYTLRGKVIVANKGIVGMWSGRVAGIETLFFAYNYKLYKAAKDANGDLATTYIGDIDTSDHVAAFFFDDKVYFVDGTSYRTYDGDEYREVDSSTAYIPCVITAADKSGSGTIYEAINRLSPYRKVRYSADGTSTIYKVLERFEHIRKVTINGVETTAYTEDWVEQRIIFNTAPPSGSSNIEVTYDVNLASDAETITLSSKSAGSLITPRSVKNIDQISIYEDSVSIGRLFEGADYEVVGDKLKLKFATTSGQELHIVYNSVQDSDPAWLIYSMRFAETYNGSADTRVFLYGNGSNKAVYSGVTEDGSPSAEYFPDLNEMRVGDENTPITAMIRHYNRLLVFKKGGGTYSIYYGQLTADDGSIIAGFYINSINKQVGCDKNGGAVMVLNRPRTVEKRQIYEWRATSTSGNLTADQRNAECVSERVRDTLMSFDMSKATQFYDIRRNEYYCVYNGTAVVQNTEANAWYVYTNFPAQILVEFDNDVMFGTADGRIYRVNENLVTDDGTAIGAFWESGSMDFGRSNDRKYTPTIWLSAMPSDGSKVMASIVTDNEEEAKAELKFDSTNGMARTLRAKLKARKFVYYKLRLAMKETVNHATILSTVIKANYDVPVK